MPKAPVKPRRPLPSNPCSVSAHRNGARRPLLWRLRRLCLLRRHSLLPLPHGRGGDRVPAPKQPGVGGGDRSRGRGRCPPRPPSSTIPAGSPGALRSAPARPIPGPAQPVAPVPSHAAPGPTPRARAPVTSLPTRPRHPSPGKGKGPAPLRHTRRPDAAGENNVRRRRTPDPGARAARRFPGDHPSGPPYTPPTNSGGGDVARRSAAGQSPRPGCSRFWTLAASSSLR